MTLKNFEFETDPINFFKDLYKNEHDSRLAKRYQAMYLLFDVEPVNNVARIIGVHPDTILNWVELFNKHGVKGLKPKKQNGRPRSLVPNEEETLKQDLLTPPRNLGYEFSVWDGPSVRYHIQNKFGKTLSEATIYRILHRLGFRLIMPRSKLAKADQKKRRVLD